MRAVGKKSPPGSPCTLKFDWKDETINVDGALSTNDFITTGQTVSLRVDPNDTSVWTDRTEPEPLGHRLIAGSVVIPAALITAAAALLLRRRLLRVWRDAEAALYTVLEVRYSALAPLSHTVSCVVATGRDPTVIVVYLPARFPRPQPGEVLWLIRRPGKAKSAIAACRVCMKRLWTPAKKRIYIVALLVPNRLACSNTPRRLRCEHGRLARQCSRLPFASGKRVASYGGCPYSSKRIWTARQVSSITLSCLDRTLPIRSRTHRKPGPPRQGLAQLADLFTMIDQ